MLFANIHALVGPRAHRPFLRTALSLDPCTPYSHSACSVRDRGPRRIALQRADATWLFDTLRTSLITSFRGGQPVRAVSARVGHASANVTNAIYSHVLPGDDEQAALARAALLAGL